MPTLLLPANWGITKIDPAVINEDQKKSYPKAKENQAKRNREKNKQKKITPASKNPIIAPRGQTQKEGKERKEATQEKKYQIGPNCDEPWL